MSAVYRACYPTVRSLLRRDGRLAELLEKLKERIVDKDEDEMEVTTGQLDGSNSDDIADSLQGIEQLCMDLQVLLCCTEPESAGEDAADQPRLSAVGMAGWFAVRQLGNAAFRTKLQQIGQCIIYVHRALAI